MRIQVAVPDEHVTPEIVDPVLEAVTRLDESMIRSGQSPTSHDLVKMGAVWRPEPPGAEHFDHGGTIAARGHGDCDDWAPLHAATLRATGEDPGAVSRIVPSGPNTFHAVVQRSDGRLEMGDQDISVRAGMKPLQVIGASGGIEVVACDPHDGRAYYGQLLPTVAPLSMHCGPQLSVRGCTVVGQGQLWEARLDLPIAGARLVPVRGYVRHRPHRHHRVHGMLPYAISLSHLAGTRQEAVLGALSGAVVTADVCGMTATLDRYKLLCAQSAASGLPLAHIHEGLIAHLANDLPAEAQALGTSPEDVAAGMMRELAGQGIVRVPTGHLDTDVQEIASGVLSACFPPGKVVGDLFGDIAKGLQTVVKPIESVYNAIPTPVKAVLAPQTIVTEYAYQHPEQIPMFGQLAAKAKAIYEQAKKAGAPDVHAVTQALTAIHPAAVPPHVTTAAHVLASAPVHPAPPKVAPKVVPLARAIPKPPGAAHAAMPVHPSIPPHPTAAPAPALAMPPPPSGRPGIPPGATHWHCAPLPGGQWACSWQ